MASMVRMASTMVRMAIMARAARLARVGRLCLLPGEGGACCSSRPPACGCPCAAPATCRSGQHQPVVTCSVSVLSCNVTLILIIIFCVSDFFVIFPTNFPTLDEDDPLPSVNTAPRPRVTMVNSKGFVTHTLMLLVDKHFAVQ